MGSEVNILRINEYVKEQIEKKKHKGLWILFIDLKSAFDTVNHKILFEKMRELEIDDSLIETIQWIYK